MICPNCKREFPDTLTKPVYCYCLYGSNKNNYNNTIVQKYNIEQDEKIKDEKVNYYRNLWQELHTHQVNENSLSWFENWLVRVPCGSCRSDFKKILKDNPPRFDDSFFEWTVEVHNSVNEKLGKEHFGLEKAKNKYFGNDFTVKNSINI